MPGMVELLMEMSKAHVQYFKLRTRLLEKNNCLKIYFTILQNRVSAGTEKHLRTKALLYTIKSSEGLNNVKHKVWLGKIQKREATVNTPEGISGERVI